MYVGTYTHACMHAHTQSFILDTGVSVSSCCFSFLALLLWCSFLLYFMMLLDTTLCSHSVLSFGLHSVCTGIRTNTASSCSRFDARLSANTGTAACAAPSRANDSEVSSSRACHARNGDAAVPGAANDDQFRVACFVTSRCTLQWIWF